MAKKQRITLQDIADELQISKASVSKALRDHPDISPETKQAVNETAQRLDYLPNIMARNLSARQSNTIGVVVPKIAHNFFATIIEAIYETAYKNRYEIILTVSQEEPENEIKQIQTLLSMRVDGLLVSVSEHTKDKSIFRMVKQLNVPCVFFDRSLSGLGFSRVCTDDELGARQATEHLISKGYSKIAHFAGYPHTNIGRDRLDGFTKTLAAHGLSAKDDWIIEGGFSEEDGYNGFKMLTKSPVLPEAIFAVTYPVALGIYAAASEHGIKIPDDIDIVCFGASSFQRFFSPSITFVRQPTEELGRRAMELLLEEIRGPESSHPQLISLPTELVLREDLIKGDHV
ncbi:LacI family DNA-binding transcriptional regulator [Candidatus Neomarinimicrobiota bacterium]